MKRAIERRFASAVGNLTEYLFDPDNSVGLMTQSIDALGRKIDYQYDADNRVTTEIWLNSGGTPTQTMIYSYDANSNELTAGNSVGTYTMAYDALNQVTGVQELWSQTLSFTYDAVGNRTKVQDGQGGVSTSVYDAANNLVTQLFGGSGQTPMRVDLTYNPDNQIATETDYSNLSGTTTVAYAAYSYDADERLTNQQTKKGSDNSNIANFTYTYDAASRVTTEVANGTTTSYAYDADGQLTGDGTNTVTYDDNGNRDNGSNVVGSDNQIASDANWTYSYDAAGNETYKVAVSGGETWEYGYDNKNELVSAQLWQSDPRVYGTGDTLLEEVDYKYDVWGNLVETDSYPTGSGSPVVTRYAVDGWNPALRGATGNANFNVWADLDGSNNLLTRYFHGDQVDQLLGRQDSGTQYWYVTDYQGSVRDVLDNSGNVKDAITYDSWGNIISETNSAYRGNYAWTGRMFDVETGLQYNRARGTIRAPGGGKRRIRWGSTPGTVICIGM